MEFFNNDDILMDIKNLIFDPIGNDQDVLLLRKIIKNFNFDDFIKNNKVNDYFLIIFSDYINWDLVIESQDLNEDIIYKFIHKINFNKLIKLQKLSPTFIKKNIHLLM